MRQLEILAPVGGEEQLIAAVRSGADAVYLGTKGFNARQNADNFDTEALQKAVAYCHARNVAVHVTMNTLITDAELPALISEIEHVADSGADAVIVQDLAVAALWKQICPTMPLHASTQMTVHNAAGVRALKRLGYSRVVLARELSIDEIRTVAESTDLEIEAFVHGALCMSVSGCCYLSGMLGERSGNRGLCAQPCRLDFRQNGREYALSLKDMSHITHIAALQQAGVTSIKIEGRMKRPEYVAAAVTACRTARDGETPDLAGLRAVFSRSGFTDGYALARRTVNMFGYRKKEDVLAAKDALAPQRALYRAERQSAAITMQLFVPENGAGRLTVSDGKNTVTVCGGIAETARETALTMETAKRSLGKTGGTPFFVTTYSGEIAEGMTLPAAALNAMRRDALEQLLQLRQTVLPRQKNAIPKITVQPHNTQKAPTYRLRFFDAGQVFDDGVCAVQIPLCVIEQHPAWIEAFGDRLIVELPALCFPERETRLSERLDAIRRQGVTAVSCDNIGMVQLAKEKGFLVHGGYGLNILNTVALQAYEEMGLCDTTVSFELSARGISDLGGDKPRGILGYGYLPLMQYRACPAQNVSGCGSCDGKPQLEDRRGMTFQMLCNARQYTTLLNTVPLYAGDKKIRGVDFVTLYFTTESQTRCRQILQMYQQGAVFDAPRTNGLYYRELK